MAERLNKIWRLIGTAISFSCFGIGGFVLSVFIFPIVHITAMNRKKAQKRCRYLVHKSFALFIWLMRSLGVISSDFEGWEKLSGESRLIVANHPSLIDVVLLVAKLPDAHCIVKRAHWKNPVMFGVMRATGFIANDEGSDLVDACVARLQAGATLVMFPEGTRTVPGQKMRFQRGAAIIAAKSGVPFTPVYISCRPTTLTKGTPWYQIPDKKPHFSLAAGHSFNMDIADELNEQLPRLSRQMTHALQAHFEEACGEIFKEHYERPNTRAAGFGYHNA